MGQRFLSTRLPSLSMNHALQGGVDACEAGVLNPACPELSSCPGADFHVTFISKCRKPAGGVRNSQIKLGAKCFLCNLNTNLKSSSMAFKGINQLLSNRRILALIPHFHFGGKKKNENRSVYHNTGHETTRDTYMSWSVRETACNWREAACKSDTVKLRWRNKCCPNSGAQPQLCGFAATSDKSSRTGKELFVEE